MKKKPVIKKFTFSKEEQNEIDRVKKGEPVEKIKIVTNKRGFQYELKSSKYLTAETARRKLFGFYGGQCIVCKQWPDYKVTYDVGDSKQPAKRIERYCQNCYDKRWKSR